MSEYKLTDISDVIRIADGTRIPNDPGNRDRQEYDRWLAEGGIPDPLPPKVAPTLDTVSTGRTAAEILGAT